MMLKSRLAVVFVMAAVLIACGEEDDQIWGFIPRGRVRVKVMPILTNSRIEELGNRLERAIEVGDWWDQYSAHHEGSPPYDPRMGVSAGEYDIILSHLSKSLTPIGYAYMRSQLVGYQRASISCKGSGVEFESLEIDLLNETVKTPFGKLSNAERIRGGGSGLSPLGQVAGWTWREDNDKVSIEVTLGARLDINRGVLFYRVTEHSNGDSVSRINALLHFDIDLLG